MLTTKRQVPALLFGLVLILALIYHTLALVTSLLFHCAEEYDYRMFAAEYLKAFYFRYGRWPENLDGAAAYAKSAIMNEGWRDVGVEYAPELHPVLTVYRASETGFSGEIEFHCDCSNTYAVIEGIPTDASEVRLPPEWKPKADKQDVKSGTAGHILP